MWTVMLHRESFIQHAIALLVIVVVTMILLNCILLNVSVYLYLLIV